MLGYWIVRKNNKKRIYIQQVDIGPTVEWGYPKSDEFSASYPSYSSKIYEHLEPSEIDTILIDGRFRVSCTLFAILKCHLNPDLKILIHDFWVRPNYHIVLNYLDEVDRVDTLGVFRVKKQIDFSSLTIDYDKYKYDIE